MSVLRLQKMEHSFCYQTLLPSGFACFNKVSSHIVEAPNPLWQGSEDLSQTALQNLNAANIYFFNF